MKKRADWLGARPQILWQLPVWIATLQRREPGDYFLRRKLTAKRPLRPAKDDNRNSHRAETELGLRRIGRPSRGGGKRGAKSPCAPKSWPRCYGFKMRGSRS